MKIASTGGIVSPDGGSDNYVEIALGIGAWGECRTRLDPRVVSGPGGGPSCPPSCGPPYKVVPGQFRGSSSTSSRSLLWRWRDLPVRLRTARRSVPAGVGQFLEILDVAVERVGEHSVARGHVEGNALHDRRRRVPVRG